MVEAKCKSSDRKTTSALIKTGAGKLCGLAVETNGTNDAVITLQDGLTATGTIILKMIVPGAGFGREALFPLPVAFSTGCYCTISGTGAACIVYYI